MTEGSAALFQKTVDSPGVIRPKKECIKSFETCFANILNLNDKGPKAWNEFVPPKFYGPLAIWPWLKISPQSSLNVISLIITAWQWLMNFPYMPCIPMQIKPIKACQGKGRGTHPLREWPCHPFSSTGKMEEKGWHGHCTLHRLGSLCEFVSSQPQLRRHCLPVTASQSWHGHKNICWTDIKSNRNTASKWVVTLF